MKILKLRSENVKRLSVVEITPDGALITIGGKNGAGKSSVLDSIAYVLGGEKLVPTQPIHTGESEAKITADLGDYLVTRRFSRAHAACDCIVSGNAAKPKQVEDDGHAQNCATVTSWGPTVSTLAVTNREGAKYPSPQALLDKLYGKLTFDPLAFNRETAAKQNEILRRLTNLDFTPINNKRKIVFDARAMDKKTLAIMETKLAGLPNHVDAQGVRNTEIKPVDQIIKAQQDARQARQIALNADRDVTKAQNFEADMTRDITTIRGQIADLEAKLAERQMALLSTSASLEKQVAVRSDLEVAAKQAWLYVPDASELDAQYTALEDSNNKARANATYLAMQHDVNALKTQIDTSTATLDGMEAMKEEALQKAQFPIPGLGLHEDDGVTFEGIPLDQVSSSVQLRVSIAIGLALNPTLKVLLIRNGNLLDDDSLKLVAEQAAEAGAQVWMEYVTSDADGVSVMLEDGHIK